MKKKLACIVGTRPQIIKYAVLRPVLMSAFDLSLLHTGQHADPALNSRIFEDLQIPAPDFQLTLPEPVSLEKRGELMHNGLNEILGNQQYAAVILFGDTDSALAGALAAAQSGIPSVHIEAGERSHNPDMPEEHNRITADRLSRLLCCASPYAVEQLNREGMGDKSFYTGDLMKDLLMKVQSSLTESPESEEYYFASIHRNYTRQNASMLRQLLQELDQLPAPVFFSLHPSTRQSLVDAGIDLKSYGAIRFLDPLSYTDSIRYQKFSKAVITDSGGMQKEAYWLMKPCITLRRETEWKETLRQGHNRLYYGEGNLSALLAENPAPFDPLLYGDGQAAYCITRLLESRL